MNLTNNYKMFHLNPQKIHILLNTPWNFLYNIPYQKGHKANPNKWRKIETISFYLQKITAIKSRESKQIDED